MNRDTPTVLKIGGRELVPGPELDRLVSAITRWVRRGDRLVLVHGGGDEITERARALGLPTQRRDGQRVTDTAMLEVVIEVLAGRINTRLVRALLAAGVPALGLSGVSGGLVKVRPAGVPPGSLGWVGTPTHVAGRLLDGLLLDGLTPVVAPLGVDARGAVYNVNADLAAAAIAAALGGELRLVTDVEAVRGTDGEPISRLGPAEARALIANGVARDGMVPKLEATLVALDEGAASAWIGALDALVDGAPAPTRGTWLAPTLPRGRAVRSSAPFTGGAFR